MLLDVIAACPTLHGLENAPAQEALINGPSEQQAGRFERYLKSGSGRAFAKRHFGPRAERTGIVCAQ